MLRTKSALRWRVGRRERGSNSLNADREDDVSDDAYYHRGLTPP